MTTNARELEDLPDPYKDLPVRRSHFLVNAVLMTWRWKTSRNAREGRFTGRKVNGRFLRKRTQHWGKPVTLSLPATLATILQRKTDDIGN